MNKQILVAGLLGAVAATVDNCVNPAVEKARTHLAKANQVKADAEGKTAALGIASTSATTAWEPVNAALIARTTAREALDEAARAAKTASDLRANARITALAEISQYALTVGTAQGILETAEGKITAAQELIADDQAVYDELAKAVVDHKVIKGQKETLAEQALKADTDADTAYLKAVTLWNTLRTTRQDVSGASNLQTYVAETGDALATDGQGSVNGSAKVLALHQTDVDTAKGVAVANKAAMDTLFLTWQPKKAALAYAASLKVAVDAACGADCDGQTDSPIKALKVITDQDVVITGTAFDENATEEENFLGETTFKQGKAAPWAVTAPVDGDTGKLGQAGRISNWARLVAETAGKKKLDDDEAGAILTASGDVDTKKDLVEHAVTGTAFLLTEANTAVETVDAEILADEGKLAHIETELEKSKAAYTVLQNDVVVKTYLLNIQKDLEAGAVSAQAVYSSANAEAFLAVSQSAIAAVGIADAALAEFELQLAPFALLKGDAEREVETNEEDIAAAGRHITEAENAVAAAVAVCKGNGYDRAQEALKASKVKVGEDLALATTVASEYGDKAAFGTEGSINFPCAMKDVDGTMTRPLCGETQCCGAAQKFRRDGTKLTVETCQEAIGVHQYTYYPPLNTGATVEPTPETWRFQCISGAQKLVAATAALAASYMMA